MPAQSLQRCHYPEEETSVQGSHLDECSSGTTAEPGDEEVTAVHGIWPQRPLDGFFTSADLNCDSSPCSCLLDISKQFGTDHSCSFSQEEVLVMAQDVID